MNNNPYEPLEDISRRLKTAIDTTLQSHTQFRDTELRLHTVGREMGQLYNRAKTGNELLKVEPPEQEEVVVKGDDGE